MKTTTRIVCSQCGDTFHGVTACDPKHERAREKDEKIRRVASLLAFGRYDERGGVDELLADIRLYQERPLARK